MKDERVTIIGTGLIGGSLCSAFKKKNKWVRAVSSRPTLDRAKKLHIIDEGFDYSQIGEAVRAILYSSALLFSISGKSYPIYFSRWTKTRL